MKILYLLFILFSSLLFSKTDSVLIGNFKFIEYKDYVLQEIFPPQILLNFDLPCNYEFVKVVRVEKKEKKTGEILISLGGVAKENLFSSCVGKVNKFNISAGSIYTEKKYKIVKIKK